MVIPTGLTTLKSEKDIGGFIEYTCEHCKQRNLRNKVTSVEKETTGHVLYSQEHKAEIFEKLGNEAFAKVTALENQLYINVNVKHNYKEIQHLAKCDYCGQKQSWSTKKGNEAFLNGNISGAPVYFNRMDSVLKRCSHCGSQEKAENRFCTECGKSEFFEPNPELLTMLFSQSETGNPYQNISNQMGNPPPRIALKKENQNCKISFWLGLLSIIIFFLVIPQLVSICFGIRGLCEIKRSNESGKAYAIMGIVFSSISLSMIIGLLPTIIG